MFHWFDTLILNKALSGKLQFSETLLMFQITILNFSNFLRQSKLCISCYLLFQILAASNIEQDNEIKLFLYELTDQALDQSSPNIHLDFLASPLLMSNDGQSVLQSLKEYLKVRWTL